MDLTKEEYRQIARERGLIPAAPSSEPGITDLLKSSLAGSIKGLEQTGANILSAPGALSNQYLGTQFQPFQVPESIDPTKKWQLSQHPLALAAQTIPEVLAPFASNLIAQHYAAGKLPATAGIPTRAATGYGIGYATSPGTEKEKSLVGLSSAAIPAIAGISQRAIGKRVTALSRERTAEFKNKYNRLFEKAENLPGEKNLRVPTAIKESESNKLINGLGSKYKKSLQEFKKNPTIRKAHEAQSDINAGIRALEEKRYKGAQLTQNEINSIEAGKDYISRIRGEMMRHLTNKGAPELAENYGQLTKEFKTKVAPLRFKEAEIARHDKKKISAPKVGEAALREELKLRKSGIAEEIPGYLMRQRLEPVMPTLKKVGGFGAAGLAASAGAGYLPSYVYDLIKSVTGK
jgi:hypothetical protein